MSTDDVQYLLDRLAIRDVMCTYYHAVDRRDWDALATVYAADVHFNSPVMEHHSRDAIVSSTSGVGRYKRTMHFMGNHLATIDGATADAETYAIAHHYYDEDGEEQEYVMGIRYIDKLRKQDGRWEIVDRLMIYDFIRGKSLIHPGTKAN